jgi:hypothetical protein
MYKIINNIKRYLKSIKHIELFYSYLKVRTNNYKIIKNNLDNFKKENSFILNVDRDFSNRKRVLIISQSDFIYSTKIELMLSFALKREGWDIVYLVRRSSFWAKNLFKWSKLGEIYFFEDFNDKKIFVQTKLETTKYLKKNLNFSSVREWRYKESWIGPQILSTISRLQNQGMPNPESKKGREILEKILPEILASIEVSEKVLKKIKPHFSIVNEPNYDINGAMVDTLIAKNISVIHYTQPSKDDSLVLFKLNKNTRRIHPSTITKESFANLIKFNWSNLYEEKLKIEFKNRYNGKYFLQSRNQPNIKVFNKNEISNLLNLDCLNKKIVCIFSPVLWDANLFYGHDIFNDFEDWLIETLRVAITNKNVVWLLKLHPANIWKLKRSNLDPTILSELEVINKEFGTLPNHIRILNPDCGISTLSLFDFIDIGITVRGTAGMELPCFGKTTLTAGTGRYSQLGFTNDSETKVEYLNKLRNIENLPNMTEDQIILAKKHAFISFYARGWKMETYKSIFLKIEKGSHPLDHDLMLNKNNNEYRDLKLFTNWVESDNVDYFDLNSLVI